MIIKKLSSYRDGGTRKIETDHGTYWMPARGEFQGEILKGDDFFNGETILLTDKNERFELFKALTPYELWER